MASMILSSFFSVYCLCIVAILANVEKTIFLGPSTVNIPMAPPSLPDLRIETLKPDTTKGTSRIRTQVKTKFPTADEPHGLATWLLLDDLVEGQRYEVRVCYAAIQPTEFVLTTLTVPEVWESPELMTSLWTYSMARQRTGLDDMASEPHQQRTGERHASILFLRMLAAANYVSHNATLMAMPPPPVEVDLILDPFLLNVLPRSLVPVVAYLPVVASTSWIVACFVAARLQMLAGGTPEKKCQ